MVSSNRPRSGDPRRVSVHALYPAADPLPLPNEARRKIIHLLMSVVPLAIWFLPWDWSALLLLFGTTAAISVEIARSRSRWVRYRFLRRTRRLLRHRERASISGATYMAIAFLLVFLLFPRPIAVVAMLYLTLGDLAAALMGKRWGRYRIGRGKSVEGLAAGVVVNVAIGFLIPGIGWAPAVVGGFAAASTEVAPLGIDDNLTVPLAGAAALTLAHALLL